MNTFYLPRAGLSIVVSIVIGLSVSLSGIGCAAGLSYGSNNEIQETQMTLVGQWQKVTSSKCSEAYPDTLEFFERGIYVGKKGEQGSEFTLWDAGGYQVLEGNQVRIAIATDEEVLYKFSTSGSVLTFVDRDGCEFQYRRVE